MHDFLFELRMMLDGKRLSVKAYEKGSSLTSRTTIEIEVRHGKEIVFPLGSLYCSPSPIHSIDGKEARELVLSCVSMRPGDTDREYFDSYTAEQLDWARTYGEDVSLEKYARFPEMG